MEFTVVIPARHASTRLPNKMLLDIAGKPLPVHVADRARASGAKDVIVATDHAQIADMVARHGHHVEMTRAEHASGTDRIGEVCDRLGYPSDHIVVNVQGDEPLIEPTLIREVALTLARRSGADVATACHPIDNLAEFGNPNVVKVVLDRDGGALYFSRALIPYARDAFSAGLDSWPAGLPAYRHIGIYAYRAGFLKTYAGLAPSPLERFEALEQLRALWHGHRIAVAITTTSPHPGVDTADDLRRVRELIARG